MGKIALIVEFSVKPEYLDAFLDLMGVHAKASRAEPGCVQFKLVTATAKMDGRVFLFEEWRDQEALDWHLKHSKLNDTRKQYDSWIFGRHITHCQVHEEVQ